MRIDHTHKKWFAVSLVIFGVATAIYVPYAAHSPAGPRGGSAIGLTFGIVGSAFMVFAGLLAGRKKLPIWRLGRAQAWMRGHLWLGLLSLPIICYHAGFHFGGPLTAVLMVLVMIVVASGLFGATLQHYLPQMMTVQVPGETIFEQIDHVRGQLLADADTLMASTTGIEEDSPAVKASGGLELATATVAVEDAIAPLRSFYVLEMRPFLANHGERNRLLADSERAHSAFEGLRTLLPIGAQQTAKKLEAICDEERQLRRQEMLHHWLYYWLMLHIPLSFALLLLGCVHAFTALRY